MNNMEIKNIKIKDLKKAEYNPRTMSDEEIEKLKNSIKEFGLVEPVVVNKDLTIIGGHQRVEAMDYKVAIVGNERWDIPGAEMIPERHYVLANEDNLADKVNELLENDKKREEIVRNCGEILENHDADKIYEEYKEFMLKD